MGGDLQDLVAGGTTLLLTTQYLEEADLLADDIVVIDHGKVIAEGTADQLKAQVGGERLEITVSDAAQRRGRGDGAGAAGVRRGRRPTPERRSLRCRSPAAPRCSPTRCARSTTEGIEVDDVGLRRPTLDDVFLTLTGHARRGETEGRRPRR